MSASTSGDRESVAVVVATRDRADRLAGALDAILAAVGPSDEVVVVDSASREDATRLVAERAGIRCVRCDQPGASLARNAGVRATSGRLVLFTDDDCLPAPDWVTRAVAAFDGAEVAFVTGRVVPDREIAEAVSLVVDLEPRRLTAAADPDTVGAGANMAWRRVALEALGGLDERMGPGAAFRAAEDHDLFWRALQRGWEGRYAPDVVVTHRQWRGRGDFLRTKWAYGVGSGALAGKALRLDRPTGARLLRRSLWEAGIGQAARDLRGGYEAGAAGALAKAAGVAAGVLLQATATVDGRGHFSARRPGA